ncbi:ion transporter [Bermanella marisrubri]|uniref:Kef-type K+ transport system, NAD-binding component n=1 Tax=Bermanella marisrubri TaxID=207949 RepID=Q1N3L3_9GAMM|nr:ion transporter [Bermanella marisrubri]EAT12861.1 Kef-type K+ transport system, NAD-binding component [Oceanobacter sp. RED65] [Bermanella marisrubri]QIZ83182.1 ion transporter [Bermanella marisrubri]
MDTLSFQKRFQELRGNKAFELFVIAVILFSALVVGAKTYDLPPFMMSSLVWLDHFITVIFLVEIIIRFLGEERKRDFFKSGWNIFDTVIVAASLVPVDESDMAFIGRLLRIFRVLRMVSIIPELRVLLNSLLKALPQLGYVMLLMFIIFYIYAAIGATLFAHINPELWGDISISMLTLFRVMTFEDWTDVMYETMAVYSLSWIYYLSFIFLTAFAFLNMVIGIVVSVIEKENAKEAASNNTEPSMSELQAEIHSLKAMLKQALETSDVNGQRTRGES